MWENNDLKYDCRFLDVDGGRIMVDGAPVHLLPPNKREMGMVFQNYALFPHMTVFNNVAYGLKLRKVPNNEIKIRVAEALEMVRLSAYENRYPRELSGDSSSVFRWQEHWSLNQRCFF